MMPQMHWPMMGGGNLARPMAMLPQGFNPMAHPMQPGAPNIAPNAMSMGAPGSFPGVMAPHTRQPNDYHVHVTHGPALIHKFMKQLLNRASTPG